MRVNSDAAAVTLAIIGCGQRGNAYATYAKVFPSACKIVAIAEPRSEARAAFAQNYGVDRSLVFKDWREFLDASRDTVKTIGRRLADAVVVCVQDSIHVEVAVAFAEQGYHVLCEKPMATSIEDCVRMEKAVKNAKIIFGMGHVLRYSSFNQEITKVIRSGELGELVNVVHIEPVGHWHFAHSYVRGNWSREAQSSFSLMTKSCHDIDLICHWLSPATPTRISSFGSLKHFKKAAKPVEAGNATRCLACPIRKTCPYSAERIYLDEIKKGRKTWPVDVLVDGVPDIENVTHALNTGPYGRCAYESNNDVCDNQVVNIEFSNSSTASFTMIAQTSLICERQTRLHFSHGELVADASTNTITLADFRTRQQRVLTPPPPSKGEVAYNKHGRGGHGGGDFGLVRAFVEAVSTGQQEVLGTDVGEVLRSHLAVFAAEKSRKEGVVVQCEEFFGDFTC